MSALDTRRTGVNVMRRVDVLLAPLALPPPGGASGRRLLASLSPTCVSSSASLYLCVSSQWQQRTLQLQHNLTTQKFVVRALHDSFADFKKRRRRVKALISGKKKKRLVQTRTYRQYNTRAWCSWHL